MRFEVVTTSRTLPSPSSPLRCIPGYNTRLQIMVLSIRYVHMGHRAYTDKSCSTIEVMASVAQSSAPEQRIQRSQFIPHAASSVVVQFLEEDSNDFLRYASISQTGSTENRVICTLNLPSTFNTISPYVDVQFGGELPIDPAVLLALAIPHRLDSFSSGVCTYGSEPVNK